MRKEKKGKKKRERERSRCLIPFLCHVSFLPPALRVCMNLMDQPVVKTPAMSG
jgi:hypothetical protein